MEYVKAMRIRNRMCIYYRGVTSRGCDSCPLSVVNNNNTPHLCHNFMFEHPEEAEKILEQWDKEHPVKTRKDDFFEKHPNAPKSHKGDYPTTCPWKCGYTDSKGCIQGHVVDRCLECWNQPMED